jgi:hypothetical protein
MGNIFKAQTMKITFRSVFRFVILIPACFSLFEKLGAATVTYRMSSMDLDFDYISVIEFSKVAVIQDSGAYRFHATSASLQDDAGLLPLPFSNYQNTYVDIFGSNDPTFISFSFDFPSVLNTEYSSATVGVGYSNGFGGLGTRDPSDIRVLQPDWINPNYSSDGLALVGAYLTTIDGIDVSPNYLMQVLVVIPEPTTALLAAVGTLSFLFNRRREGLA